MSEEIKTIGRPSKLGESLIKAKKYLLGEYKIVGEVLPSIAGLACYLGISRSTVYEYQKENKEFSDIVEGILALQESKLINSGLQGDFNPTIAKLLLAKHGYSDKVTQELTGVDGKDLLPPALKIVIGAINEKGDNS